MCSSHKIMVNVVDMMFKDVMVTLCVYPLGSPFDDVYNRQTGQLI